MRERIDLLLVERRLVESKTKAQWLIRNELVEVNGVVIKNPAKKIDNTSRITLKSKFPYVEKRGLKLEAALKAFSISAENKICMDIGASIGGFTDCLLKYGALRVYAIDIAVDLLHPSLRCDKTKDSVVVLMGIDARKLNKLREKIDLCTIDIPFTSMKSVLSNIKKFLTEDGIIIALFKPLMESTNYGQKKFNKISNLKLLNKKFLKLIKWAYKNEIFLYRGIKSPNLDKKDTIEYIFYFRIDKVSKNFDDIKKLNSIFII
jgi:23S rRNA (cytidine1920-2'-O)/16S rRNA (cytidine1409-2'-O)-methyltransferase